MAGVQDSFCCLYKFAWSLDLKWLDGFRRITMGQHKKIFLLVILFEAVACNTRANLLDIHHVTFLTQFSFNNRPKAVKQTPGRKIKIKLILSQDMARLLFYWSTAEEDIFSAHLHHADFLNMCHHMIRRQNVILWMYQQIKDVFSGGRVAHIELQVVQRIYFC